MTKEIPVFFAVDDAYAPFLSVALCSASENISHNNYYRIIVLHQGVSKQNIDRIKCYERHNFKIDFLPMTKSLECITDRMSNRMRSDCFTLTIYFRLFIAAMFPMYDKAIYIDSDVVISGDIAELFNVDIADNYIGACADHSSYDHPVLAQYMLDAVGVDPHKYINSGVLLMNLKALREKNLDTHFLNLLNTYHFDSVAPDQDYINAICKDKIFYLDSRFNTMPNDSGYVEKAPVIIHYNLFSKPWNYDDIQYENEFWKYARKTKFYDEIVAHKNKFGDEQKALDKSSFETLVSRCEEIPLKDVTLRKIGMSGVKIKL